MAAPDTRSLDQLLLQGGWVSPEQLAIAQRRQQELGGQLGTALLEMEALGEVELLALLAEHHSMPAVPAAELSQVPAEVRDLLPAKVATRHKVVAFRAGRGRVDLAVREEPDIPTLDELSFVLGRRVVLHIACEPRIYQALNRYYGKDCPLRFRHLLERLDRPPEPPAQERQVMTAPPPKPPPPPKPRGARPARATPEATAARTAPPRPPRRRPTSVPLSDEEKKALRSAEPDEVVKPLSQEGVQQALQSAHHAGDIGSALAGFLGQEFIRLLLFRVEKGKVRGWMGRSPSLDEYRFRSWTVGFDEPSVFLNLSRGAEFFLGKLPAMPAHERLLRCWRGSLDTECAVFPVKVRNRLVSAVYGDRDSLGLAGLDVPMVQQLTAKAAIAFEMLLMQRKLKS